MKQITIVGAGFAGLTLALRLAQNGFQVDIFEKASRVGGLLGTDKTEYGISERAANAMLSTERARNLFKELGIVPSTSLESSKRRFIFRSIPKQWPLTFFETLTCIFRFFPKILFRKKSLKPSTYETLENWGKRNLGNSGTQYILGPAMQGIYGNDIQGLSASLILGGFFSKNKREKSKGLLTGPGGMQDLVNHLESELIRLGVKIHLNTEVDLKNISGPVVIASSASAATQILTNVCPELSKQLKTIKMSSLISVTLFFRAGQTKYQGFGCLIPRGLGLRSFGILMNSYIFADRNKTYNETWILGGVNENALLNLSEEHLLKLITDERTKIFGSLEQPHEIKINRWPNGLPYYDINLEKILLELQKFKMPKGFYLHGNYLGGIGLSKILERSENLAEVIKTNYG